MALRLPLCLFGHHTPRRSHMRWNGAHFVSTCRFCKSALRKQQRGGWKAVPPDEGDEAPGPVPAPHHASGAMARKQD